MRIFQRKKSEAGYRHDRLKQRLDADIDHLLQGKELDMQGCDAPVFDSETVFHRLIGRITHRRRHPLRPLLRWGVAAVVVLGVSVWAYKAMRPQSVTYREVYAQKGERLVVVLADGTQVYLNADSRLTYPTAFSGKERRVQLQGEAYFTVEKDADKPFIVESYDMMIKVTGTQFNVMAYPESPIITTTLDEGKILVGHKTKHPQLTELYPGQEALYKKGENTCTVQSAHTGKEASCWKENRLVFHNAG
ncbi:MAG: FecR family protein, partial [Hoylesella saccharolytica]